VYFRSLVVFLGECCVTQSRKESERKSIPAASTNS